MEVSSQSNAPVALPPCKNPGTHWKRGWVDPRTHIYVLEKRKKSLLLPGFELHTVQPLFFSLYHILYGCYRVLSQRAANGLSLLQTQRRQHTRVITEVTDFFYGTQDAHRHYGNFYSILKGEIWYYGIGRSLCLRTGKKDPWTATAIR